MKKIIFAASVLLVLVLLVSCYDDGVKQTMLDDGTDVKMTAIVKSIGDKIEVEVIEGEYGASGIFWVNYSAETVFVDANDVVVSVSDIEIGDTVIITYGGQVAMSYPPQISAKRIQIK